MSFPSYLIDEFTKLKIVIASLSCGQVIQFIPFYFQSRVTEKAILTSYHFILE